MLPRSATWRISSATAGLARCRSSTTKHICEPGMGLSSLAPRLGSRSRTKVTKLAAESRCGHRRSSPPQPSILLVRTNCSARADLPHCRCPERRKPKRLRTCTWWETKRVMASVSSAGTKSAWLGISSGSGKSSETSFTQVALSSPAPRPVFRTRNFQRFSGSDKTSLPSAKRPRGRPFSPSRLDSSQMPNLLRTLRPPPNTQAVQ
mmetsp:Transcript_94877/g.225915  ORF Transcript_94877/g.225915 Transcript_94877/m.225915 type:complete len:206 (-) Transcript_94877:348-965(-)